VKTPSLTVNASPRCSRGAPPTGDVAISESERLIRDRIARLTEMLTELDDYSTLSLLMRDHDASTPFCPRLGSSSGSR
jgi:hypothetical protein